MIVFSELVVILTRFEKTGNIGAFVSQQAADGKRRGKNILAKRNVRRIETGKQRVIKLLGRDCEHFIFEIEAGPDRVRKPTKGIPRKKAPVDSVEEIKLPWE